MWASAIERELGLAVAARAPEEDPVSPLERVGVLVPACRRVLEKRGVKPWIGQARHLLMVSVNDMIHTRGVYGAGTTPSGLIRLQRVSAQSGAGIGVPALLCVESAK